MATQIFLDFSSVFGEDDPISKGVWNHQLETHWFLLIKAGMFNGSLLGGFATQIFLDFSSVFGEDDPTSKGVWNHQLETHWFLLIKAGM